MTGIPISQGAGRLLELMGPMIRFFTDSEYSRRSGDPSISNFVTGDPQEFPLPQVTEALSKAVVPQTSSWLAYTMSDPQAQRAVSERLRSRLGIAFEPADVCFTPGAFGALFVALKALIDTGDEVITVVPNWPFYQWMILAAGGEPVEVAAAQPGWDLDVEAIGGAITGRTRAIIVNTPNNPTGRIYPAGTLTALAGMLEEYSERLGRTIYLLSDESYSRIVFDGRRFVSPCSHYADSLLIYTYGKVLSTPGLRIGYLALNPSMEARELVRGAVITTQIATGWQFPSSILQYIAGELDDLSIDLGHLQSKRDRLVSALKEYGYEVDAPEATLFLLVGSPLADSWRFAGLLEGHGVFVAPGALANFDGLFRISLTATDEMIDRALPGFKAAFDEAARISPGA